MGIHACVAQAAQARAAICGVQRSSGLPTATIASPVVEMMAGRSWRSMSGFDDQRAGVVRIEAIEQAQWDALSGCRRMSWVQHLAP